MNFPQYMYIEKKKNTMPRNRHLHNVLLHPGTVYVYVSDIKQGNLHYLLRFSVLLCFFLNDINLSTLS